MKEFKKYKSFYRGDWITTKTGVHGKLRYVYERKKSEAVFVLLQSDNSCLCFPESLIINDKIEED